MNIKDIQKLVAADSTISTATLRAHLQLAGITDSKEQTALLAESGIGRRTSGWTQTNTLGLLESGVTEDTLYSVLIEEGAVNELRWVGDRNRIRITMNAIYSKLGEPVHEKPASESLKAEAKELVKAAKK